MAATKLKTVKIDVISDFSCPWCYIGYLDLERAMERAHAAHGHLAFSIQFHPFILNPKLKCCSPVQKAEYYIEKFGEDRYNKIKAMVLARAKQEGLNFSFDGVLRQTTRAHRLMHKAYIIGGQTVQLALLKALFKAYFEDALDIGDVSTLASFAVATGVTKTEDEARVFLESTEYEKEVLAMSAEAQRKGITGVPFSVIEQKWAVSGCQPASCFDKIFEKLATTESVSPPVQLPVATAAVS